MQLQIHIDHRTEYAVAINKDHRTEFAVANK